MCDAQWVHTNLPDSDAVNCFAVSGSNIFAGTHIGVFLSSNNGTSWTAVDSGLTNPYINALAVSGTNLFAGAGELNRADGGVFLSTNNGTSWTAVDSGLPNVHGVSSLAVMGTNLFAAVTPVDSPAAVGVCLSTNNGTSWSVASRCLRCGGHVTALAVSGTNLFAGTSDNGVWRRPLSEMVAVDENKATLPERFSLEQNYPNPFNPSTNIKFELPRTSQVNLSVFDILGHEVSVLVNERRDEGVHEVTFDGFGLASGVYLYRLQAGDFISTKKMSVLK